LELNAETKSVLGPICVAGCFRDGQSAAPFDCGWLLSCLAGLDKMNDVPERRRIVEDPQRDLRFTRMAEEYK